MHPLSRSLAASVIAVVIGISIPALAENLTLREVTEQLFKAPPGTTPDLSAKILTQLDLSDLDFKRARLTGSDLYGADLSRAKLAEANLAGARLDRALLTATDFSGADLAGARILRPTIFTSLEVVTAEAPRFTGAKMTNVEIAGWLDRTDFRAADLSGARFVPRSNRDNDSVIISRSSLISCNFTDSILRRTIFAGANLSYARFANADLRDANLRGANLTRADFTGADLSGADVTGANIDEADLRSARGLDTVIGLDSTENKARALTTNGP